MSSQKKELEKAQAECEELRKRIQMLRDSESPTALKEIAQNASQANDYRPQCRYMCTGHFGKIYALQWGNDARYVITASQDGKLIVW